MGSTITIDRAYFETLLRRYVHNQKLNRIPEKLTDLTQGRSGELLIRTNFVRGVAGLSSVQHHAGKQPAATFNVPIVTISKAEHDNLVSSIDQAEVIQWLTCFASCSWPMSTVSGHAPIPERYQQHRSCCKISGSDHVLASLKQALFNAGIDQGTLEVSLRPHLEHRIF